MQLSPEFNRDVTAYTLVAPLNFNVTDITALGLFARGAEVGPGRCCPPHRPPHSRHSLLEINDITRRGSATCS